MDSNTPSNKPLSGDDTISDSGTSSKGHISNKYKVTPVDEDKSEDDESDNGDGEDYKEVYNKCEGCEECNGFDKCKGCKDCNEYNKCEGCKECEGYEEYKEFGEEEEDPDNNLQDFVE